MSDGSTTDSTMGHGRREYLTSLTASMAIGLAGCTGFVGGGGGDGDDGGGDSGGGGSDPFASVEVGPETITAEIAEGVTASQVAVRDSEGELATDADDEPLVVDVERGTAEVPVSVSRGYGLQVILLDGEYTLVAEQEPEEDGATPTVVGERAVTIERSATVTGIEAADDEFHVSVENTGEILVNVLSLTMEVVEATGPGYPDPDMSVATLGPPQLASSIRVDDPGHDYRNRGDLIETIVPPGETGVFRLERLNLYGDYGATDGNACTGQSAGVEFTITGEGKAGQGDMRGPPEVVRGRATATLSLSGGVGSRGEGSAGTIYSCNEVSLENVEPAE